MADYRYYFHELLSNRRIMELPLEGVTFGRKLNGTGSFQGYFGLDREGFDNASVLEATAEGKVCLYITRDDYPVWGGIIWSTLWTEQSGTLQLNGATLDSYFDKVDIERTLNYVNVDQRNIMIDLIVNMQSKPSRNIRIVTPAKFTHASTNITRTERFNDYEVWRYSKAIEQLVAYDNSFDYYIDVRYNEREEFERFLCIGNQLGATAETSTLSFNYPGNIANFYYPSNAGKGATTIRGIGAGEGVSMYRTTVTNEHLLSRGYPEVVQFYTDKALYGGEKLQSAATQELRRLSIPYVTPTFEVNPEMDPQFGSYMLGDSVKMLIESARFPGGKIFVDRIIGWDVTPTRSDSQEQVSLTLERSSADE